jgi:hypothetical protein
MVITVTLYGAEQTQTINNLIPNRKYRLSIPNIKFVLPLQQGRRFTSTVGAKNRNTHWRGQIETEFCDSIRRPMARNRPLPYLHPYRRRSSFPNMGGRVNDMPERDDGPMLNKSRYGCIGGWRREGYRAGRRYF